MYEVYFLIRKCGLVINLEWGILECRFRASRIRDYTLLSENVIMTKKLFKVEKFWWHFSQLPHLAETGRFDVGVPTQI